MARPDDDSVDSSLLFPDDTVIDVEAPQTHMFDGPPMVPRVPPSSNPVGPHVWESGPINCQSSVTHFVS